MEVESGEKKKVNSLLLEKRSWGLMTFVCMEVQGGTIFNKNSFLILEFHNFSWRYYL